MGQSSTKMQAFTNFPRQKLKDSSKNDNWYKNNIDFAENILISDSDLRNSFKNKKTNYDLRANIINVNDFQQYINPDNLDLSTLPANFQHVGIENSKLNLLIGEYSKRKKEYRAYLSSNDQEGISRKEGILMKKLNSIVNEAITNSNKSKEEIQKDLKDFSKYTKYDFQDIAEITANKILKKEYKTQNLDFLFLRTFEDLLVGGEQIVYCGVLGGEPVMRRVNTMNLYTFGGNTMNIEDSDIIVEYGYQSVGAVIDDYWDELKDKDIDYLERGSSDTNLGLNRDMGVSEYYGSDDALQIFHPNSTGTRTFAGAFDTQGKIRVLKVCWRSRRKIGKRKYYDEDGEEQYDYVDENYVRNDEMGEEIEWKWVNEWLEGTKIGDDIYVGMKPVPYSGKSLVNKSKGTPPYVGTVNSTNGYAVQSLTDIMKPLTFSYDIAYYKRELEIATYKGSFAAINASMVPSGWDPKEWIRYATINKIAWLDPTNEILKGPAQGKSAGAYNTVTATSVQVGDPNAIQMYTNLLVDIENTLGKVAGVTGAREGQIQNREAVGNVEREVAQTSHITEKWFTMDANFRKRALTKFLECCKYAYKQNPKKAQYLLDDMGMEMIDQFDEFVSSEMDIHISNSTEDTQLYQEMKSLSQAAIQNGQAKIEDLIAITQSESVQEIARKLKDSAERIADEQKEQQAAQQKGLQEMEQMKAKDKQIDREFEAGENEKDRQVKYAEIEQKDRSLHTSEMYTSDREARVDTDKNGIDDHLDIRRTDVDENFKNNQIRLKQQSQDEKKRSNLVNEELKQKQITSKNKQN